MVEIISAFHEGCGIRDVGITTNGTLEKTIIETVASVFDEKLVSNLSIQVSLDGLGATHDRIRGVKGAFDKAFSTVKELRRIQKTYPRLNVKTCLSVEKQNISELKDYVEYLLPLKLPLRFNIVRGGDFGTGSVE